MAADPPRYVPRVATESILVRLEEHVGEGGAVALLLGPAGIGKTLLLQVLATRLGDRHRCVHVPHAALRPEDVCAWILGLMGEAPGDAPDETLAGLAEALAATGSKLVLLIDEAASLEPATAVGLASLVRSVHPGASLVLAGVEDARMDAIRKALGRDVTKVRFDDRLSRSESDHYVSVLLARDTRPDRHDARLDEDALEALHDESDGNPAALEELLEQRAREGTLGVVAPTP
jgi:type II secretory pathway predicted ATPase ExeA